MLELAAVSFEFKCTTAEIARKAENRKNTRAFKEFVADLKNLRLIGTKEGRTGGCWLTPAGIELAKRLSQKQQ
jgi:hypothetical protein